MSYSLRSVWLAAPSGHRDDKGGSSETLDENHIHLGGYTDIVKILTKLKAKRTISPKQKV